MVHSFCQAQRHSLTSVFNSYQVCKWQDFMGPASDWMSRLSESNRKSATDQMFCSLTIFQITSTYLSANIQSQSRHGGEITVQEPSLAVMCPRESSWQNNVLVSSCSQVMPLPLLTAGLRLCWSWEQVAAFKKLCWTFFITLWQQREWIKVRQMPGDVCDHTYVPWLV